MVLILASGLLVMLALVGAALTGMVRQAGPVSAAGRSRLLAGLSAESGMAYAEARLLHSDPEKPEVDPSVANRSDDWSSRDDPSVPLESTLNPSFSRGESWEDTPGVPGGAGRYDPGIDVVSAPQWTDLDGDGRFSAWTGRIRGGEARFSLEIRSTGSFLPVNAGCMEEPYCSDILTTYRHKGLAYALDNLGAFLLPEGACPGRRDIPSGEPLGTGEPIRVSTLGQDLLKNRPRGGYRDEAHVRSLLLSLGYAAAAADRLVRWIDTGPYEELVEGLLDVPLPPFRVSDTLVELRTAPRETLASLWLYCRAISGGFLAENAFITQPYSRAGSGLTYANVCPSIFPDEALALADEVIAYRRSEDPSWPGLARRLFDRRNAIFPKEMSDLAAFPAASRGWAARKIGVAMNAVSFIRLGASPSILDTWGWDVDPDTEGTQPPATTDREEPVKGLLPPPSDGAWTPDAYAPFVGAMALQEAPLKMTLAPPVQFRIRSLALVPGGKRLVEGRMRLAERLEIFSQAEFENLGSEGLSLRRIFAHAPPPGEHRPARSDEVPQADGGAPQFRSYSQTASGPAWNPRTHVPEGQMEASYNALRAIPGWVGLAGREGGAQGALQYWSFREDFDGLPETDFLSEPPVVTRLEPVYGESGPRRFRGGEGTEVVDQAFSINEFSLEAWFGLEDAGAPPEGLFSRGVRLASAPLPHNPPPLVEMDPAPNWLYLRRVRETQVDALAPFLRRPGTRFRLSVKWTNALMGPQTKEISVFIPDVDPALPLGEITETGFYHAVVTVKPAGMQTRISLYVNGRQASAQIPTASPTPGNRYFSMGDAGEVRIYTTAIDLPYPNVAAVEARRVLGRFVQPRHGMGNPHLNPLFRSCRYRPAGGARLMGFQWTGFTSREIVEHAGMRLRLIPWQGGSPGQPVPIPDNRTVRLDIPCDAFEYDIEFFDPDPATPPPPLPDSPVFRQCWILFRRPGETLCWTAWTDR